MNKKKSIVIAVQIVLPLLLVIVLNNLFTITFSWYFVICTVALIASIAWNSRNFCWTLIATASVVVTLNYLRPDIYVYSNADHHIIELRGLQSKDSLVLVDSDCPRKALFDSKDNYGSVKVRLTRDGLVMDEKLSSHPLYFWDADAGEEGANVLENGENLVHITKSVRFERNGRYAELELKNNGDSLACTASFYTDGLRKSATRFDKVIEAGYPLVDILRSAKCYSPVDEHLLSCLRYVYVVKDTVGKGFGKSDSWYLTIPENLCGQDSIKCFADGTLADLNAVEHTLHIDSGTVVCWGFGNNKSRAVWFECGYDNEVVMHYDMPIMYGFPRDSVGFSNHIAVITSSSKSLLSTEISEAFYFNLFEEPENDFNFNGTISYQTETSPKPLSVKFVDSYDGNSGLYNPDNQKDYTLKTQSGNAVWNLSIVNLREESPLTGKPNPFTSEWLIVGLVLLMCFVAYLMLPLFAVDGKFTVKSRAMFNIWCFVIPFFTLRLYLMWRVAVFPPVGDITKSELMRYTMENTHSENAMVLTFVCIALLMAFSLLTFVYTKFLAGKHLFARLPKMVVYCVYAGLLVAAGCCLLTDSVVGNVVVPILVFFANEYICLTRLKLPLRIVNVLCVLAILARGDAGYAMVFFFFVLVYYCIQAIVFRHSGVSDKAHRKAARYTWLFLAAFSLLLMAFAPVIVSWLYSDDIRLGLPVPDLATALIALAVSGLIMLLVITYLRNTKNAKIITLIVAAVLVVFSVLATIFVPGFLNDNKHVKYRSLIHIEDVGHIMMQERVADRDNQRLLEASQNQWFMQHHSDLGADRVKDSGIMHLYPHFRKGVSWSTQISDVICSRYIIAELSMVVPLTIILFSLVFLIFSLRHKSKSAVGKTLSYGVALLLLVQTVFVWMANTNRMIFLGQDMPFLSLTSRFTLIMFCILLFVMMLSAGSNEEDDCECDEKLMTGGFDYFNDKRSLFIKIPFAILLIGLLAVSNKNPSLNGSSRVSDYNPTAAMAEAKADFGLINAKLAEFNATRQLTVDDDKLPELFEQIDREIGIDRCVEEWEEKGEINTFSASLYRAFRNNFQVDNRIDNIVFLQYVEATNTYRFVINDGFYAMRAPEMKHDKWSGNVYSYGIDEEDGKDIMHSSDSTVINIYRIPRKWLRDGEEMGIADVRSSVAGGRMYLMTPSAYYHINSGFFVLNIEEYIESTVRNKIFLDRLTGHTESLLAKDMTVNGEHRFFYPLGSQFFWVKDFSEMLASQSFDDNRSDCNLTIDMELMDLVYDTMKNAGKTFSVVALDGLGNVRLMAEYDTRRSNRLDPNDKEVLEKYVVQSYLNPNYNEEAKVFGNQNLVYMLPGPGSTLKPITYAAVTSQVPTSDLDWETLKLHKPTSGGSSGRYYMTNFGPDYRYPDAPFMSLSDDEVGIDGWVDNRFYLYRSSNYYNALITYLGNYEQHDFERLDDIMEPVSDLKSYPTFSIGGRMYRLKGSPSRKRENSVLNTALSMNFKMNVTKDSRDSVRFVSKRWMSGGAETVNHPWVFPASSNVYMKQLQKLDDEALRLKRYAIGASPLQITPMMMAEMYGRLFSMHPDYYACITADGANVMKEKWDTPNKSTDTKQMFNFYKNTIFEGMYKCANDTKGTAYIRLKEANLDGYHLYAKTGTLSLGNGAIDDRMLVVVITNKLLSKVDDPSGFKFYVVYFRYKQSDSMVKVKEILKMITESKSFAAYMR